MHRRLFLAAATLIVAAACTDQSPTGLSPKPRGLRSSATDGENGRPTLFSNAVKYRDEGMKPAHGRSGSASLTARAMLGKDGATTLDITTGDLDVAGAPGSLKKIQLKQFDPNGNLQVTSNYKGLTGATAQFQIPARIRGSALQVQGNVTGIDGRRTDVVTITETVKLRPDIALGAISAAAEAVVGTPVNISAVVSEANGDLGARSDCVLSVDGAEVDRANGIWVDAGRSVSCVFLQTFTTLGAKQLTVRAVNVSPGDFDDANNSASASLQIVAPPSTNDFTWYGNFYGRDNFHQTDQSQGYWTNVNGEHAEWSYQNDYSRYTVRNTGVNGQAQGSVGTPFTFQFSDRVDGTVLDDFAFDPAQDNQYSFDYTWVDASGATVQEQGGCATLYRSVPVMVNGQAAFASVASASVCAITYTGGSSYPASTAFGLATSAGDVSYYSRGYSHVVNSSGEYTYSYNQDVAYTYGTLAFGGEYSFRVEVAGPNGTKRAAGTMQVTSSPISYSQPYACYDWSDSFYTQHSCNGYEWAYTWYTGFGSGTPDN
jgi:hypothetical protein